MSLCDRTNETTSLSKHDDKASITIDRDFDDREDRASRLPPWITIDVFEAKENEEVFLRVTPEEAKKIRDRLTLLIASFGE